MKLQILSDLHLERQPSFCPSVALGADILILAGDVGCYQVGSLLNSTDFGLSRFAPGPGRWNKVVYVPGNHEYDNLEYGPAHERLQHVCDNLGIIMLEKQSLEIEGIRFLGTTLWSDFDALATNLPATATTAQRLSLRDTAYRAANSYLQRCSTLVNGKPLLAEQMRDLSLQCQAWLHAELQRPHPGPTVVVTHFAPSLKSADPRYGMTPGTAGFCNALDYLVPQADLWIHGHLHCSNDYHIGKCRVVSNSLGYTEEGEQENFIDEFVIDL